MKKSIKRTFSLILSAIIAFSSVSVGLANVAAVGEVVKYTVTDGKSSSKALSGAANYRKLPYDIYYIDNGSKYSLMKYANKSALSDGIESVKNFDFNDAVGKYKDKSGNLRNQNSKEVYMDVIWQVGYDNAPVNVSEIYLAYAKGSYSTYNYEIYASDNAEKLGTDESFILEYFNKEEASSQLIEFPDKILCSYIMLRVKMGIQPRCTAVWNLCYARLSEIAVFSDEIEAFDYEEELFLRPTSNEVFEKYGTDLIKGNTAKLKVNGIAHGTGFSEMTDGDFLNHTDHSEYYAGHTEEQNNYIDLIYDLGSESIRLDTIVYAGMTSNEKSQYFTGRYQVFMADDFSKLFNVENRIYEYNCRLNESSGAQRVTWKKNNPHGCFIAIRLLESTSDAVDNDYLRTAEFAVYGNKYDDNDSGNQLKNMPLRAYLSDPDGNIVRYKLSPDDIASLTDNKPETKVDFRTNDSGLELVYELCHSITVSGAAVSMPNSNDALNGMRIYASSSKNGVWDENNKVHENSSNIGKFDFESNTANVEYIRFSLPATVAKSVSIQEISLYSAENSVLKEKNFVRGIGTDGIEIYEYNPEFNTSAKISASADDIYALTDGDTAISAGICGAENGKSYLKYLIDLKENRNINNIRIGFGDAESFYPVCTKVYFGKSRESALNGNNEIAVFNEKPSDGEYNILISPQSVRWICISFEKMDDSFSENIMSPSLSEISVFGTEIQSNSKGDVDLHDSLMYGIVPNSWILYDEMLSGTGKKDNTLEYNGSGIKELTDGKCESYKDFRYDGVSADDKFISSFIAANGSKRDEKQIYDDIVFSLDEKTGNPVEVSSFYLSGRNEKYMPKHFKVYLSSELNTLTDDENCAIDFYNTTNESFAICNLEKPKLAAFMLVRIYCGVSDRFDGLPEDGYASIGEIAIFGEQHPELAYTVETDSLNLDLKKSVVFGESVSYTQNSFGASENITRVFSKGNELTNGAHGGLDIDIVRFNDERKPINIGNRVEQSVDLVVSLTEKSGVSTLVDGFYLSNPAAGDRATYRYAVYISKSLEQLSSSESLAVTYTNISLSQSQYFKFGKAIEGAYLLVRIIMSQPINGHGTDENDEYEWTYSRLDEIAVFGKPTNAYSVSDGIGSDLTKSVIYGTSVEHSISGTYAAMKHTDSVPLENNVLTDGDLTTGRDSGSSSGSGNDDEKLYRYNNDFIMRNSGPSLESIDDFIFDLRGYSGNSVDVNSFLLGTTGGNDAIYKIEIYASLTRDGLSSANNLVAVCSNKDYLKAMKISLKNSVRANYVMLRVIFPRDPNLGRRDWLQVFIKEFGIFGETNESFKVYPSKASKSGIYNSCLKNVLPTAIYIYDDGNVYDLSLGNTALLTDCNLQTAIDMTADGVGTFFKNGKRRNCYEKLDVYTDIIYKLDSSEKTVEFKELMIGENSSGVLSAYSREIYAANSVDELGKSSSLIASLCNLSQSEKNLLVFNAAVSAKYIMVRTTMGTQYDVLSTWGSDVTYARTAEIALFEENTPIYGDVNNDGYVDVRDMVRFKKYAVCTDTDILLGAADMDENGKIEPACDLALLRKYLLFKKTKTYKNLTEETGAFSIINKGDFSTVADKLNDFKNGGEHTLAFIDISGIKSTVNDGYKQKITDKLTDDYPEAAFNMLVGNYVSESHLQSEILSKKPSIIFVADNVIGSETDCESLIKTLKSANYAPAVIVIELSNSEMNKYDGSIAEIAAQYDLPMISYAKLLNRLLSDGDKWSKDNLITSDGAFTETTDKIIAEIFTYYENFVRNISEVTGYEARCSMPIAATGSDTYGSKRTVNIDTSKTVFKDYMSIGTNIFSGTLTSNAVGKYGFNKSYFEIQKKQMKSLNVTTGRLLFCVDWMVTNTEKNPNRSDWRNNSDYKNYINGIYDFDNETMQSMYTYLDAYKEIGTEITLNFGWKASERIAGWYSLPLADTQSSAPRDLTAFSKAAAALMNHLINEKNYSNIKSISFYNEPFAEYGTIGNKPLYYADMINKTYEALKNAGLQNKVKIVAAEHTTIDYDAITDWFRIFEDKCGSALSGYTQHSYFHPGADIDYQSYFDYYTRLYGHLKKPITVTEYLNSYFDKSVKNEYVRWNYSDAAQLIASANTGMKGLMSWEMIGGYVPSINYYFAGETVAILPTDKETTESTGYFYNGNALINNYIGSHANVLQVDWSGKDIRAAAFKRSDGEYTVIVEANGADTLRELTLNFSENLGKKVYKYEYDYSARSNNPSGYDSIIPQSVKTYENIEKTLSDTLSEDYRVYIYTTAKPKKQIAFGNVWNECERVSSISLSAEMLDCSENDKIEWSVVSPTGSEKGTISSTGVYTPAATAKFGDTVAVRAQLAQEPEVYSIAIIKIK